MTSLILAPSKFLTASEALPSGPVVPVPATDQDIDAYLDAWDSLVVRLTS